MIDLSAEFISVLAGAFVETDTSIFYITSESAAMGRVSAPVEISYFRCGLLAVFDECLLSSGDDLFLGLGVTGW
jgi:hypothetical protein